MPFFKSRKNRNASSESVTRDKTPRQSLQELESFPFLPQPMTQREALQKLMKITMGNATS
ncbi:hypothetical protein BG000_003099, partial [Podila horticola]